MATCWQDFPIGYAYINMDMSYPTLCKVVKSLRNERPLLFSNAVFFRIGVLAYNLFIGFKRLSCPESWVKQTIATFRWKMVQVAERLVRHAGETVLRLMLGLEKLELFRGIRKKSFELSLCPDGWNGEPFGKRKDKGVVCAKGIENWGNVRRPSWVTLDKGAIWKNKNFSFKKFS